MINKVEKRKEVGKEKINDKEPCLCEIRPIAANTPQHRFFKGDTFFYLENGFLYELIFYGVDCYYLIKGVTFIGARSSSGKRGDTQSRSCKRAVQKNLFNKNQYWTQ